MFFMRKQKKSLHPPNNMLYSSQLMNDLLNDPNLKEEGDGMNIENELFAFYTKKDDEGEQVYSDQEARDMIEEATVNINKHFVTVYWEETGSMDIFEKRDGELFFIGNTMFLKRR